MAREEKLQRTVGELEGRVSELKTRASELEVERDEARESSSAHIRRYEELEKAHRREVAKHKETKAELIAVRVIALVMLVLLIGGVLQWLFVLR